MPHQIGTPYLVFTVAKQGDNALGQKSKVQTGELGNMNGWVLTYYLPAL